MNIMNNIFHSENIKLTISINIKTINMNIKCDQTDAINKTLILYIKPKNNINVKINSTTYKLKILCEWFILISNESDVTISRNYNLDIYGNDIEKICIYEYSKPNVDIYNQYEIFYCFDKNYIQGAFASIYSLLHNFDSTKKLYLNLMIPNDDIDIIMTKYLQLYNYLKFNFDLRIYLLNNNIIPNYIKNTQCFKGGNHLLKLSNFSRLIIGNIINSNKILYLDSDTIIQTDLSKKLDKIQNHNFVIMGKKAGLNYNNLLNSNNIIYAKAYLGNDFDFSKNVIYTGTLLINPNNFRKYENDIRLLVNLHNNILDKGGLYKLFTMSIINLALNNHIEYFDDYINNVVDLGHKNMLEDISKNADVLDWSGIYKPWFVNGLYREFWQKYNLLFEINDNVTINKNTIESF